MKIAQITSTFPPYKGGMGAVALNYARELSDRGHDITTFTPRYKASAGADTAGGNMAATNERRGIGQVERLRPLVQYGNAACLPQVFFRLGEFEAVILHYPFFGTAEVVYLARALNRFKGKFILQYHMDVTGLSFFANLMSYPSRWILPGLIRRADLVLTSSLDYVGESDIKKWFEKHRSKFFELPFGADLNLFHPGKKFGASQAGEIGQVRTGGDGVKGRAGNDSAKESVKNKVFKNFRQGKTILFVGGLDRPHYFKGLDILLKAVGMLAGQGGEDAKAFHEQNFKPLDLALNVIGDGELKPQYEKLAAKLGIEKQVNFIGSVAYDELPEYYRQADVFVLPSVTKGEAFGLVLVEAMASGTPVIASDLAGVRKVFENGKEGFASKPGDAKDLADKLRTVLIDEDLRLRMGKAARKKAEEKYDWKKVGQKLESLIIG